MSARINLLPFALVISIFFSTLVFAQESIQLGHFSEKSLFGHSDIKLLDSPGREFYPLSKTVGSLYFVLPSPPEESSNSHSEPTKFFSLPICTGIHIAPQFILTTAHCDHLKLFFSKLRITQTEDKDKIEFTTFGPLLRLIFQGALISEFEQSMQEGLIKDLAYKNEQMDFAIFKLQKEMKGPFLNLQLYFHQSLPSPKQTSLSSLQLISHPHGIPLALSSSCRMTDKDQKGQFLFHDCDSLEGSSGGLIIDPLTHQGIGLHLQGPGPNDGRLFSERGHFESPEEFARKRRCPSRCPSSWSFNKGLLLSALVKDLKQKAPELWEEIIQQSSYNSIN